ncbi:ataxin-10-like isoform X2 [Xenia sp. Carnegie-2017]|uniref:ataxin-10-like isoform X2 n=1 Tax=Xenia sp. Carnegie-2017 TaxID=2897299 RepID=UPI001F0435D2|nr:ataxin-10-like isoform X2 [Xenia sp. Carnegie-2017]
MLSMAASPESPVSVEGSKLEKWNCCCNVLHSASINSPSYIACWDEIANSLSCLKVYAKEALYRSFTNQAIIEQIQWLIERSSQLDFQDRCNILCDAFRFLRNCCAGLSKNQDSVMSSGIPSTVMKIIQQCLSTKQELDVKYAKTLVSTGIQMLGNLVVENLNNQRIIWRKCYPRFFMSIMQSQFNVAKNYACMIIYNCIKESKRRDMFIKPEGILLVNTIFEMCTTETEDIEWGMFIVESLLENELFQMMYDGLQKTSYRVFLLQFVEQLSRRSEVASSSMSLTTENAIFLCKEFEYKIKKILPADVGFDIKESSNELKMISSLLHLLCLLSSFPEHYKNLRCRKSLLETILVALRETTNEENKKFFSDLTQFVNPSDHAEISNHPAFAFKKGLIQLIANMSYKNTSNQNDIRQLDCIPLLLNHCNIDANNPYICQWAIFCLRNVLENNLENQEVVRSLTKLGLAPNIRLAESGFVVEETKDGKIRVSAGKP